MADKAAKIKARILPGFFLKLKDGPNLVAEILRVVVVQPVVVAEIRVPRVAANVLGRRGRRPIIGTCSYLGASCQNKASIYNRHIIFNTGHNTTCR